MDLRRCLPQPECFADIDLGELLARLDRDLALA
jgi:hypothetical protein